MGIVYSPAELKAPACQLQNPLSSCFPHFLPDLALKRNFTARKMFSAENSSENLHSEDA